MANSKRVSLVSYGHSLPLTRLSNASFRYMLQRPRRLIQDKITISEAPWGIHKHNCNSSRTVWENAEKTNETLVEISVPGTGAFPHLLPVPAASEFWRYRSAQESAGGSCLVRSSQLFRRTARKNEIKGFSMRKTIKRSDPELAPEKASWLDVSTIAQVEVTSEDAQYPIESAFAEGDQPRMAGCGARKADH
jgi:hypothetical protein